MKIAQVQFIHIVNEHFEGGKATLQGKSGTYRFRLATTGVSNGALQVGYWPLDTCSTKLCSQTHNFGEHQAYKTESSYETQCTEDQPVAVRGHSNQGHNQNYHSSPQKRSRPDKRSKERSECTTWRCSEPRFTIGMSEYH